RNGDRRHERAVHDERAGRDRGSAGVSTVAAESGHTGAVLCDSAGTADHTRIRAGERLIESQAGVIGDLAALQAIGVADQRSLTDRPILRAGSSQIPGGRSALGECVEIAELCRGPYAADIEAAGSGAA